MTIKEVIFAKLTSAQFLMANYFSITYCLIMIGCTVALLKNKIQVETYVALLGAFALIVREIADDYFKRNRSSEKKEEIK